MDAVAIRPAQRWVHAIAPLPPSASFLLELRPSLGSILYIISGRQRIVRYRCADNSNEVLAGMCSERWNCNRLQYSCHQSLIAGVE